MATREGAEKPLPPNFQQKENYTRYIASRPRAERISDHALFSGADEPVVLFQVVKEVANHPGNVWKPIISLQREDAERLGYDNAQAFLGFRSMEQESHDDKLQYRIGWMLLRGMGTEKDEAAARVWLEKASRLGNPHAQYQLAKIILADPDSSPEQVDSAVEWLTRAAEGGNEFAQYALGKLLLEKGEEETGIRWLTMAAEQEKPFAQYALGKLLLEKGDKENGVRWLTASAAQGNIYAQYFLLHLDDFRDQMVRQGVVRLFHHLGNLFLEQLPPAGQGVKMGTDHKLRRKLRQKKAAQGHKRDDHEPVMTS